VRVQGDDRRGHAPADWNLLLLTEYKDLASCEASQNQFEALVSGRWGEDRKQMEGYRHPAEIREVVGERLMREIVLEPRSGSD
jgi:hypothetical protein